MQRHSPSKLLLLVLACLIQAPNALAYFDPASGSLILQMVLGGIAGVAVILKLYWHKLLDLLGIRTASDEEDEAAEADEVAEADEAAVVSEATDEA